MLNQGLQYKQKSKNLDTFIHIIKIIGKVKMSSKKSIESLYFYVKDFTMHLEYIHKNINDLFNNGFKINSQI